MSTPLIVPVQVDALLVNEGVLRRETFHRWYADFSRLDRRNPPEPDPFLDASDEPEIGIHLQWLLPDALRHGQQDGPAGKVEFRIVPNRWLVVRYSRPADRPGQLPTAVGWIVESDFLDEDDGTSEFLDPWRPGLQRTAIGQVHRLAEGPWQEPRDRRPFLTAAGPGLATFAMFQPYNRNVFSFHDELTDLDDPSLISYLVVGWYSDPAWDVLHAPAGGDIRALLDSLRWSTTDGAFRPTQSFCAGSALHLCWDREGDPPSSAKPDHGSPDVAVGHIVTDAETALLPAALNDPEAALLWEAFSYDLLDILDEDGEGALDQATRRTWFDAEPGGYTWRIVDRPAPPGSSWPKRTPEEAEEERRWLAELNATQAEHDAASRELAHLQRRLFGLWWLNGRRDKPTGWNEQYADQTALRPGTLADKVQQQIGLVFDEDDGLRSRIPWGDTAGELATRVGAYADGHHLAPGRELQRCAEPPFHHAPDPSVIIRGAKLDRPLTDEDALACRSSAEVVTHVRLGGVMTPAPATPPAPGHLDSLPQTTLLTALLGEFYLLDRAAATPGEEPGSTALDEALDPGRDNVTGIVARWTRAWEQQPWLPLFLIWKMNLHPTPYRSAGEDQWQFDGTYYRWREGGAVEETAVLTGRAMLSPLPSFNTRARLAQHAATHPRGPVAKLLELRRQADEWDLLSQRIDGINNRLAAHGYSTNLTPSDVLGDLVDNSQSRVSLGEVPDPGPISELDRPFRPVRAAQLTFEQLYVIDRFGQSLHVIGPDNVQRKRVDRADSVTPDILVNSETQERAIGLPPRLLQPARLRLDFVSTRDDHHRIDVDAGPREAAGDTPVCGWLLANRLDRSLLVHAPDGAGLGEIRIVLDTAHRQESAWYPLPDSPYPDVTAETPSEREFAEDLPHLHGFVTGLLRGGANAFTDFLDAVDASMSTTAAGGDDDSLAALVGRPLALLRCRLRFELDGPPMTSSSWRDVVDPPEPEFTDYLWNVRLGAGDMLGDGLAGFFAGSDYTRMHTVVKQKSYSQYTVPINGHEIALPARPVPARDEEGVAAWVTLLADPWAAVHAVSDILPVGRLVLPPTWVREPLSRIKLSFRLGPLLAGTRAVPGAEGDAPTEHVVMPGPSAWRGTWAWAEPARTAPAGPARWDTRPLTTPDPELALSDTTPAARTGFLQLSGALGESDESERRPPAQGPGSTSR